MGQQTKQMVEATDSLQTEFDSKKPEGVLVVPVDWAADEKEGMGAIPLIGTAFRYWDDQKNAKLAGSALWKLFSGLKKEERLPIKRSIMAHSMGNRVLRCMGKEAVEGDASWNEEGLQGKSLLQAAPADLKNQENLFENIFFVAADIPECVFEEPDGPHVEQAEHALQSGVAALAVMTKRMHVLHGNGTDGALNKSFVVTNPGKARLGSRGPWSSKLLGRGEEGNGGFGLERGEPSKVWGKFGDALTWHKTSGVWDKTGSVMNNGNVHVKDCSPWNTVASHNGHSYQFAPEAVAYYLEHMCSRQSAPDTCGLLPRAHARGHVLVALGLRRGCGGGAGGACCLGASGPGALVVLTAYTVVFR